MNEIRHMRPRVRTDAGGEGSRGGKVIGHTGSGKPIYQNHKHPSHGNFTSQDHRDAEALHQQRRRKLTAGASITPTKEQAKKFNAEDTKIFKAIEHHSQKAGGPSMGAGNIKSNAAAAKGMRKAGF